MTVAELGAHRLGPWIFNCWVVPDGGAGRPLVVDLGVPSTANALSALLDGESLTADPIVVATHMHVDHVAGIPRFEASAACDVCLPPKAADYEAGEKFRLPGLREVAKIIPVFRSQQFALAPLKELATAKVGCVRTGYVPPSASPTILIDGDAVPGAPDWQVMVTPGHSEDSTSLWNERTRTLISGDAILSVGPRAWFNPETIYPAMQAETEDRLRSFHVDVLLPGHGRPVVGRDVLARALGFRARAPRGLHRVH